jgi:hypothetical protein
VWSENHPTVPGRTRLSDAPGATNTPLSFKDQDLLDLVLQEGIHDVMSLLAYGHEHDRRIALFAMRNRTKLPGMLKAIWEFETARGKAPARGRRGLPRRGLTLPDSREHTWQLSPVPHPVARRNASARARLQVERARMATKDRRIAYVVAAEAKPCICPTSHGRSALLPAGAAGGAGGAGGPRAPGRRPSCALCLYALRVLVGVERPPVPVKGGRLPRAHVALRGSATSRSRGTCARGRRPPFTGTGRRSTPT